METNESILTRSIVGLDERKVLGKMSSLRVDYDTQAVSHYIVMNASTNNAIALPFENAIAVGDTFITVQSYGSFVDANSPASKELVSDSNKLVGVEVYSRTGNTLGTVAAFDFDPIFGAIKSITLDNGSEFKSDVFLFFAPDFVFVDDGARPLLICARLKTARTMLLQLLRQAHQQPKLLRLHNLLHLPLMQTGFLTRTLCCSTSSSARR